MSTVTVYADGAFMGTATADASGSWSFLMPAPLSDGPHAVAATAKDSLGNTSQQSVSTFTVDTTPPAAQISFPTNGSFTLGTLSIEGTAEANCGVTVYVDGHGFSGVSDGSGNWSISILSPLADGTHTVSVIALDQAGNIGPISGTITFTVDTVMPDAPTVTVPANGSVTNDSTPAYSGSAEALSTVAVYADGTQIGTAAADGSGNWSLAQPSPLSDGSHTVKAQVRDAAGNTSPYSAEVTFEVDTNVPVTVAAIGGAAIPVKFALPVYGITETSEYTGTVAWSPADDQFRPGTVYTATITLSAKAGYSFRGIPADFFTVGGATAANSAESGVITAVFPATEPLISAEAGPSTFTYDLYAPSDIAAQITFHDASSVLGVTLGTSQLASPADYTVSGSTLTVSKSFLAGLLPKSGDTLAFKILFDKGAEAVLTVNVKDTAPKTYTVTFNDREEVNAVRFVQSGMAVGGAAWPESPKRNGFAFGGWYTGKNGSGSVFTADTVVLGAVYVYAKWTKSSDEQDSAKAPQAVTLNGENTDLAALIPGPGGSGTQALDISDENLENILRPGFALEVTVPDEPASEPNRIPAAIMQSLFGTVLTDAKAPENMDENIYDTVASIAFPGGLINGSVSGGTTACHTKIGTAALPSGLRLPEGGQALPQNAGALVTMMSGEVLVQGSPSVPSGRLQVTYVGLSIGGVPVLEVDPATPVLISIPYTLSGEAASHPGNLRVMHVSENGETSEMMGSRHNPETGTMDFATSLLGCFVVVYVP